MGSAGEPVPWREYSYQYGILLHGTEQPVKAYISSQLKDGEKEAASKSAWN